MVARLKEEDQLVDRKGRLALPDHQETFSREEARLLEEIESLFRNHPFDPPGIDEIGDKTGASPDAAGRLLLILCEHEKLVRVAEGLFFHRQAVDRAREILIQTIQGEGKLESVKFKYLLDTTRKFAIPLLDYFDDVGVTRRVGNTRFLKTRPSPEAASGAHRSSEKQE
jgi:selenocysteine-specific elongation factor